MQKMDLRAILRGGAAAAITFVIVEIVVEGAVSLLGVSEADLFQDAFPEIVLGGLVYHAWNVVQLFLLFFLVIWLYAAMAPRFGTGLRGALVTSAVLWFMYFLFATNLVNLGIFPLNIAVTNLAFNLVEIPLAVLVGTRIYNRSAESD
jgi:hypothetical protein